MKGLHGRAAAVACAAACAGGTHRDRRVAGGERRAALQLLVALVRSPAEVRAGRRLVERDVQRVGLRGVRLRATLDGRCTANHGRTVAFVAAAEIDEPHGDAHGAVLDDHHVPAR